MDRRMAQDLDNYITGHYGEDFFRDAADYPDDTPPECENCASTVNVTCGPDPYQLEINDDDTDVWLCANCRQELADGI